MSISYSHLKLIRFSVAVLVCAHWLACGFYLVVTLEDSYVSSLASSDQPPPSEVVAEISLIAEKHQMHYALRCTMRSGAD